MPRQKVETCVDFMGDDYLVLSGAQSRRKDKRRSERVSIVQEIECEGPKGRSTKRLADIGMGGMFIEGLTDSKPGTLFKVRFHLGGAQWPVGATVKVVYVQEGFGVGVQYLDLTSDDAERLKESLSKLSYLKKHINGKAGKISRVIARVPVTLLATSPDGVNVEEKTEILALAKNGVSVRATRILNLNEPVFVQLPTGVTFEGRASWIKDNEVWIECRSIAHGLGFRFP